MLKKKSPTIDLTCKNAALNTERTRVSASIALRWPWAANVLFWMGFVFRGLLFVVMCFKVSEHKTSTRHIHDTSVHFSFQPPCVKWNIKMFKSSILSDNSLKKHLSSNLYSGLCIEPLLFKGKTFLRGKKRLHAIKSRWNIQPWFKYNHSAQLSQRAAADCCPCAAAAPARGCPMVPTCRIPTRAHARTPSHPFYPSPILLKGNCGINHSAEGKK